MINLDLLKKLTRLANNNPNENEANLAARKVCRMLEEGKWSLPQTNQSDKANSTNQSNINSNDLYRDIQRIQREELERRRKQAEEYYKQYYNENKVNTPDFKNQYYGVDWDEPYNENLNNARKKKGFDAVNSRELKCTKCGRTKLTHWMNPDTFICSYCIW